jgi:hypothetical protein
MSPLPQGQLDTNGGQQYHHDAGRKSAHSPLPTLIANENNPERMKTLAAELDRLLSIETTERTEKDGVDHR